MPHRLTCVDLFSGCGGISLGFERAGINVLAAVDSDPKAVEVYRENFPRNSHVLRRDLTLFSPQELADQMGTDQVDIVAGGPPCQGYSNVRQVDGANHGHRLVSDPRRSLYKHFLRFVDHFQPKAFFMENVMGIMSAEGGMHFEGLRHETKIVGYRPTHAVVNAVNYGVPQSRRRMLFLGIRNDIAGSEDDDIMVETILGDTVSHRTTLWDAIGDLPPLGAGEGEDPCDYDVRRRVDFRERQSNTDFLDAMLEGVNGHPLTAHVSRPHNPRDLRDFARLQPGENSKQALDRGVEMEFPYNRDVFQDKYSRLDPDLPSRTILAHMSRDGLMYIHPEQIRSLTPREAARLQSFPDNFQFPVPRTHQYRLIGNAVPPMLAERVAQGIMKLLDAEPRKA